MDIICKTWQEVLDQLQKAIPEQLAQPVRILGENMNREATIYITQEAMYDDGECIVAESELSDDFVFPEKPDFIEGSFIIDPDFRPVAPPING